MSIENSYSLSKHAAKRSQQRSIPESMLTLLMALGAEQDQKGGTSVLYIPKRKRKQIRRQLKQVLSQYDALQNTYMVITRHGHAITAGHSYE